MTYLNEPCAFDIETTTIEDHKKSTLEKKKYLGFMYVWQFCIKDKVVFGRTWEEFQEFLERLSEAFSLGTNKRMVIYVHYLAFEFQFVRNFIGIETVFARKKRVPMKVQFNMAFEFRCSYFLSNMSLDKFVENTPKAEFLKRSGDDYDYKKVRLPNTALTEIEKGYCYCDVRGLCEAIDHLLKSDTMNSIPLTSTGFLRREVRKAVLKNPQNKDDIKRTALTPTLYVLCKTASRGGNTHANGDYSDILLTDMKSKDRKSSYPAEMMVDKYPVTPFHSIRPTSDNLEEALATKACLLDITLHDISIKPNAVMPYLSLSKLTQADNTMCDNGRVVAASKVSMVCTDVDFKIIQNQYKFSRTNVEMRSLHTAEYGRLNKEFRLLLREYFEQKTMLENGDPYLYAKFKNRINAFFGMMLTDICSPEIIYKPSTVEPWSQNGIDIEEMLAKYYNKRTSFLAYQHGIWVTANARKRLQDALDKVGHDSIYTDTDSVKYIGEHEDDFVEINEDWLADCEDCDIAPYVDVNGKRTYLGVWENDGDYSYFKTLGAKKYAYIKRDDPEHELHITVAGLNKKKGAKYLSEHGGIKKFSIGTVVPKGSSGRTVAYYNDESIPRQITIDGYTFTIGSNVAVVDAEYTFGISDDYALYLASLETRCIEEEDTIMEFEE